MKTTLPAVLTLAAVALSIAAPHASAAALAPADGAALVRFVQKLGDGTYTGAGGTLDRDGEAYTLVETRVISQQKTLDGFPGVTLRLFRRASLNSNPAHVETEAEELSLAVRGDLLVLKRDGHEDQRLSLDAGSGENGISFSYDKLRVRYGATIVETLSLRLDGAKLSVTRAEGAAGRISTTEAFAAAR